MPGSFYTCLTVGPIWLLVSFYQRAPRLTQLIEVAFRVGMFFFNSLLFLNISDDCFVSKSRVKGTNKNFIKFAMNFKASMNDIKNKQFQKT